MKKNTVLILSVLLIISILINAFLLIRLLGKDNKYVNINTEKKTVEMCKNAKGFTLIYSFNPEGTFTGDYYRLFLNSYNNDADHCSFYHSNGSVQIERSCNFTLEKFDELVELVCKGNPRLFEASSDENEEWGAEVVPKILSVFTKDEQGEFRTYYIECSNLDRIEEFYIQLDTIASK